MNKIIIMHPCILTWSGLYQLFRQKLPGVDIVRAQSVYGIACRDDLHTVDLIVSELYGLNENISMGAKMLSFIQATRKANPLLIATDVPARQVLHGLGSIPGASCISLSEDIHDLVNQIELVLAGNVVISPSLCSEQAIGRFNGAVRQFSRSEMKVYNLLQEGLSITQIAKKTSRSIKTVSAHKRNMMEKLGVDSDVEFYACFNQ